MAAGRRVQRGNGKSERREVSKICGRFFEGLSGEEIEAYFQLEPSELRHELAPGPRYNIGPGQAVRVVRSDHKRGHRTLVALHWGLVPHFATDRKGAYRAINARAESVDRAPLFRAAFAQLTELHDRMPVIVAPTDFGRWLGEQEATRDELKALLWPAPEALRVWPVDPRMNRTEVDEPSILEPITLG